MSRHGPGTRASGKDDAGFSLIELMVTMGVMSILMVIFTTAILQVYRANSATESLSLAQSQLQLAFQRVDRELRYASWIGVPDKIGATSYVAYADADGLRCGQLRLADSSAGSADGVLQLIQWKRGTPSVLEARLTLSSMVVTDGVDPPFALQVGGATPYSNPAVGAVGTSFVTEFQRLRIRLTTRVGNRSTQVDTTFTALNTTRKTLETNDCNEGKPTS
jgi:prepilin-type N-terminal cleavage/methylation domain-containing protein